MFQWTFSQFWPLGLHSNQLKLWNITFWLRTQRKGPAVFHLPHCLISYKGCGGWEGAWAWWCGRGRRQPSPPGSAGSAHPGPPPPHPSFQQKPGRPGRASSNSGYRIYSVSSLSHSLSTIKRDFHERQECR